MKKIFLFIFSLIFLFSIFLSSENKKIAYKEKIITPHLKWEGKHIGGNVKALFLVNNLSVREPYELEQRFDIYAKVVPVRGDAYGNRYDEDFLMKELLKDYDVLVIASTKPWESLSSSVREKIREKIENGLKIVIFGAKPQIFSEIKDIVIEEKAIEKDMIEEIERHLPVKNLEFRGSFNMNVFKAGKGRIFLISGYDLHWCFFTAFLPFNSPYFENEIEVELFYALAGRIIRYVSGKEVDLKIENIKILTERVIVGEKCEFELKVNREIGDKVKLFIEIYSNLKEKLDEKIIDIEDRKEIKDYFIPLHAGKNLIIYKLKRDEKDIDSVATLINVLSPSNFEDIYIPEVVEINQPIDVQWEIKGITDNSYRVYLQIYDYEGNLLFFIEKNISEKRTKIPVNWIPEFPYHKIRVLLAKGEKILDEKWKPIFFKLNREEDSKHYNVILWGMEYGSFVERYRYQIFKKLGIDALASANPIVLKMASEEGLRIVPTNIFVPPNLYKPKFDKDLENKKLETFVKDIYKYVPLGYSLADEPSEERIKELNMKDLCEFRNWAAEIIHQYDKKAKVGYCGVWWGLEKNVPYYFSNCDFVEAYSPFHLYTPNLWLGIERDLYRSFVLPNSIFTCWTHYAPGKDLEPYSRVVPWLWLFEGFKGVSYFASAGEFGILTNEWQTTHETRWWSQEIKEIKKGIGEQILKMNRDVGVVRILFYPTKNKNVENWAFALNKLNIPYKFISFEEIEEGIDGKTKLLICPDVKEISNIGLENIQKFVKKGGWIIISGPFGILKDNKIIKDEKIENLIGVIQLNKYEEIKKWEEDILLHGNIPSKIKITEENILNKDTLLTGVTTGIHSIELKNAKIIGKFEQLGDIKYDEKESQVEFIEQIFHTPAITQNDFGKGKVLYFSFTPDIESAKLLISKITSNIGIHKEIICTKNGQEDDTIYIYPFKDKEKLLVGIIQNYWVITPSFEIEGHESDFDAWESKGGQETINYFYHGAYLWKEEECILKIKNRRHIYDVRKGIYKGFDSEVKFGIKPGNPELFAFLPYKIKNLNIISLGKIRQGEILKITVDLKDENNISIGEHVINIELIDSNDELFRSYNIHTEKGKGEKFILIPLNRPVGQWKIVAKDSITGIYAKKEILVEKAELQPRFIFNKEYTKIEYIPLSLPEGNLISYREKGKILKSDVEVNIAPLTRKRMYIDKEHSGHEYLVGSFSLTNSQMSYEIIYSVCNDWKIHKWEDERIIWAPYIPGLGIRKPQPHIWYYNGYIQIFLDDFDATSYRISEIRQVESGKNGRVDVIWDTPYGEITLSFLMMPDHIGIFQKLNIKPKIDCKKIKVRFRSYPGGFGRPSKPFVFIEDKKRYAVLCDEINDRAFGKGRGPGAILLFPDEWNNINYNPHATQLEKNITNIDNKEIKLHWVIWLFPEMSNKEAFRYMSENADDTTKRLKEIYK